MQRNGSLIIKSVMVAALFGLMLLPATIFAQRRYVYVRPRRTHVVVYSSPSVIYRQTYTTPYYGYTQPYPGSYYNYGYPTPYYGTSYYSYNYSPYYVNPYAYSLTPAYNYTYREYRPLHRRSHVRFGIYLR